MTAKKYEMLELFMIREILTTLDVDYFLPTALLLKTRVP
jgi:hypothetical protein